MSGNLSPWPFSGTWTNSSAMPCGPGDIVSAVSCSPAAWTLYSWLAEIFFLACVQHFSARGDYMVVPEEELWPVTCSML